jgi:hypothetical protein
MPKGSVAARYPDSHRNTHRDIPAMRRDDFLMEIVRRENTVALSYSILHRIACDPRSRI